MRSVFSSFRQGLGLLSLSLFPLSGFATEYELTLTNEGLMDISASVLYVLDGDQALNRVGQTPSTGFVAICEKGNAASRLAELEGHSRFVRGLATPGHLRAGQSTVLRITLDDPRTQSLHFETMYAKTKETCGVLRFPSQALRLEVGDEKEGRDLVIESGAFTPAVVPAGGLDRVCADAKTPTACLRLLSRRESSPQIRAFMGHSPSVFAALERRYGAAEVRSLMFTSNGILSYRLRRL